MKTPTFSTVFTVEKTEHTFEHYVNLTSKMIGKPYYQTFKMVEKWPLEKIRDRYYECEKLPKPAMVWYGKRKKDLGRKLSYEI